MPTDDALMVVKEEIDQVTAGKSGGASHEDRVSHERNETATSALIFLE
jgi:hypothetical protein